jgi:hypothetical protein
MKLRFQHLLAVPVLLTCASCVAAIGNRGTDRTTSATAPTPGPGTSDAADVAADKLRKKERELGYARMELEIAKLSSAADERESDVAVEDAKRKLEVATKDRDNFMNMEKPTQLAGNQLSLDRSKQSMEESKQELVELEAMYKQEDFAELTKELVISRGRKRLEFSQRGFELAQKAQQELVGHDLPKKEMEANQAVEKAEKALREVQAKKDRGAIEIKLKLMRAEHKIDDLEREIEKMKKKSEKKEPAA